MKYIFSIFFLLIFLVIVPLSQLFSIESENNCNTEKIDDSFNKENGSPFIICFSKTEIVRNCYFTRNLVSYCDRDSKSIAPQLSEVCT